jgi:hypothetical protein
MQFSYSVLYKKSMVQECLPLHFIVSFSCSRLRALSSGGSITSPPLSPALPKYKLADYRYGREEMLALFLKDNKVGKCSKLWLRFQAMFRDLLINESISQIRILSMY